MTRSWCDDDSDGDEILMMYWLWLMRPGWGDGNRITMWWLMMVMRLWRGDDCIMWWRSWCNHETMYMMTRSWCDEEWWDHDVVVMMVWPQCGGDWWCNDNIIVMICDVYSDRCDDVDVIAMLWWHWYDYSVVWNMCSDTGWILIWYSDGNEIMMLWWWHRSTSSE